MKELENLKKDIRKYKDAECAKLLQRYFKTGPGEYGEGDIFLGLKVGQVKNVAKKYQNVSLSIVEKLLTSKIHEQRTVAIFILIHQFEKADLKEKNKIYKFYLKNISGINNWDLVDISCHKIIGKYLDISGSSRDILYKFAKSSNFWKRRISIITTFQFIRNQDFKDALKIAEILLNDKEDLIHKAVGWVLRAIGDKNFAVEEKFLKKHYKKMPRTMLRYAIEKFPEEKRQAYLKGMV